MAIEREKITLEEIKNRPPLVLNPPEDVTLEKLQTVFPTINQDQTTDLVKSQMRIFPEETRPLRRLLLSINDIAHAEEYKLAFTRKVVNGILPKNAPINLAAIPELFPKNKQQISFQAK